jgi:hypothetical protein
LSRAGAYLGFSDGEAKKFLSLAQFGEQYCNSIFKKIAKICEKMAVKKLKIINFDENYF